MGNVRSSFVAGLVDRTLGFNDKHSVVNRLRMENWVISAQTLVIFYISITKAL